MITMSLDTSCLNPKYSELDELAKLSLDGKIIIYFEIPGEVETMALLNKGMKEQLLRWVGLYTQHHHTTFKAGETPPLADKRYGEILHKVIEIHSPELGKTYTHEDLSGTNQNSMRVDCKLCAMHIFFGSQYFVTNDKKGFINQGKKEKFEKTFNIKIRVLNRGFIDELKQLI
jgi:hypothetical protein